MQAYARARVNARSGAMAFARCDLSYIARCVCWSGTMANIRFRRRAPFYLYTHDVNADATGQYPALSEKFYNTPSGLSPGDPKADFFLSSAMNDELLANQFQP